MKLRIDTSNPCPIKGTAQSTLSHNTGRGYQTLINEVLRAALAGDDRPVTEKILRKILREELGTN